MIKAQEAYNKSVSCLSDINTLDIMLKADSLIKESSEKGYFCAIVQPIESIIAAEKVAIELRNNYGYNVSVLQSGVPITKEDGSFKPAAALKIDWIYLPANVRDEYGI